MVVRNLSILNFSLGFPCKFVMECVCRCCAATCYLVRVHEYMSSEVICRLLRDERVVCVCMCGVVGGWDWPVAWRLKHFAHVIPWLYGFMGPGADLFPL